MKKVLVCVNDGLLKLRIERLLGNNFTQFFLTDKPINRNELNQYGIIVIHSSYRLTDLFAFIENVVTQKISTIIYITSNVNSNPFRRFVSHANLIFVEEGKMDIELPYAIELYSKYAAQIEGLNKEKNKLSKKIEETNSYNRCKLMLIGKGYSEEDAHKYILKYAMDNQIDKNEACNRLLGVNTE